MSNFKKTKVGKTASVIVSLTTMVWLSGAAVMPLVAQADTVSDLQAKIQSLLSEVTAMQAQLATLQGGTSGTTCTYTFAKDLKQGSRGDDVKNLQKVLNMNADTQIAASGAGSPGNETSSFGALTKAAVIKFQNKYASDILIPLGLKTGSGYVGASTRAKLNAICTAAVTPVTPVTPTTPSIGTGLTVSSPTQPTASLAPPSAAMVPFTKVTLTAGTDGDVVVNGIQVERTGLAVDANFAGIVLLDENGMQLGIAKTLNSLHKATVGEAFTVKAGQSRTMTIAGNMAAVATLLNYAGQVAYLSVTGISTSATVTGTLPITGAGHTINATLTLGTAVGSISSYDPGTTATKAIGTTGYKFTGVRITAGSVENVRLKSVRFYQAGSAGSGDLSNVMVYVDGTAYPTTVSTDGKYYAASLGSGIVIEKGLAKDIWIAGDITGSGSSGRTVDFDIQKNTDVYVTGETYGYGIIASGTITTSTPSLNGYAVTISAGSFTSVTKATSVAAQNIAINLANQVLGGYVVDITGEPISVQSQIFHIASTTSAGWMTSSMITSISLYDENGAVVAGPVDAVADSTLGQKVTFTDTVTYPIGKHTFTLKGKIPTTATNGGVLTVSTTPATATDWTNITGQTTGNTIPLALSVFTMNQMTIKSAALAVAQSTSPAAQTIVAGGTGVTFANFQLDASQSGEDVRLSSITLKDTIVTAIATNLTGCQLWDGATALNTGSNVVNPTVALVLATPFTFDQSLTVAKGTVKTLTLKCNVASGITGSFTWNITAAQIAALTVTGVTSGTTVVATGADTTGATQTIGTGSLVVSTSPSSPSYAIVSAGSTGNTVAVLRFRAANEGVNLSRIGLKLTSTASSSVSDFVQVSIWDGSTQIGTATFTGTNTTATSTLAQTVALPKDADKDLTVKVDLAQVGSGYTGTQGALIAIDNNASTDPTGTQGTGVGSGTTINATGSTAVAGIRLFKSFPTFVLDTLPSSGIADGRLMRFKVTANTNGGVGLNQFKFTIATSTITGVTLVNLFGYTDSGYSTGISGFTSGQIATSNVGPGTGGAVTITPSAVIEIPYGTTYFFELRGTVAGVTTGSSVTATLLGDSTYSVGLTPSYTAGGITMMATSSAYFLGLNNLVWSPNATTTAAAVNADWTNGYGVVGLPSSGLIQTRSN